MTRKSKSGNALKHATGLMKVQYMRRYVELRDTIRESNDTETCPICNGRMNGRPLWMVGKYDYCYNCYSDTAALAAYEEQRANERAEKHATMVMDVCHEIRDCMTQDQYNAWWESAPEEGFFSAACDQLLAMKLGTESDGTGIKDWQDAPEYKQAMAFSESFDFAAIPEVKFVR